MDALRYAVYRGGELVAIGTVWELCNRFKVDPGEVMAWTGVQRRRRGPMRPYRAEALERAVTPDAPGNGNSPAKDQNGTPEAATDAHRDKTGGSWACRNMSEDNDRQFYCSRCGCVVELPLLWGELRNCPQCGRTIERGDK